MRINNLTLSLIVGFFLFLPIFPTTTFASTTSGTIDVANRYAWSENAGWIDFGTTAGAVTVTDAALTGYAYGENIGWISLNCSTTSSCGSNAYAVTNNGEGTLSGYAWSENAGWINFAPAINGVTISSAGVFSGYAYSENLGWINFTADHPVTTDWRPASTRNGSTPAPSPAPVVSSGGGGGSVSNAALAQLLAPSPAATAYLASRANPMPLLPTTAPSLTVPPAVPPSVLISFTRNLTLNSSGTDIKTLQVYLNTHGFPVATIGAGSSGHETITFGLLTQRALVRFQKAHGISPAAGYFGPLTRAFISNH